MHPPVATVRVLAGQVGALQDLVLRLGARHAPRQEPAVVALGLAFSGTLIDNIREGFPGMVYVVPWSALTLVIVVGYAASLVTTYLPARRASKVYPAEALRYE